MASRRDVLRLGARVAAAGVVGGLATRGAWLSVADGAPSAADQALLARPLRSGHLPITDASALLVAHERGLWQAAGLPSQAPALFRGWDALAQAFAVGELDVVHLLLPLAVQLRLASKAPMRVIGWGHTNGSALTVRPAITDTAQLAGATIAVPSWWSVHSVLTQRLLTGAGLRAVIGQRPRAAAGTVELVVLPPAEMVSALAQGGIAGFAVADPFNAVAEVQGIGRIHRFLGDVWRDHACCAIAVREDLIAEHPAAVQAIAHGLVAAQSWLSGHPHEAPALLSDGGYLPQPLPALSKVFERTAAEYSSSISHPDWHGERLAFEAYPHRSYTEALVTLMQTSQIDGDTTFLDGLDPASVHDLLVDDRFVSAALAEADQAIGSREEVLEA
ncbi:MAG: ABC transporter substrate-binding protein [Arachnia sp.]